MTSELLQEAFLESVADLQFSLSLLQCGLSERQDRKQGSKIQTEDVVWGDTQGPAATEDSGLKTTQTEFRMQICIIVLHQLQCWTVLITH